MIENYQVGNVVAPLGAVLALDLLTTVTQTPGTTNQGTVSKLNPSVQRNKLRHSIMVINHDIHHKQHKY